ncbi:MAG: U32 family peptidase [Acetatifactor sp.]
MGKRVELLAPAGNAEGFYGAIHAGADAVYLGGSRFGARAYAENFTSDELVACIRYGHLLGRKIYLTVNTLLKEQELPELYDYLSPFYEAGLDGVIIQDMGVLRFIKEHFPGLELHASTQMTLCSKYGARLLKEMGASRIVPARELSLEELSSIKQDTEIELETFIHGAMCYCYSGQCLFSSILGGRSGNRGRCAQPCRLPYSVKRENGSEGMPCYPLSLKDMYTIGHIPALIDAGIDSFKIEGRMKKPEYSAGVTAIYRKYIDSYYELKDRFGQAEARQRFQVQESDLKALSALYIRSEIQDGYYFKHNGKEMITISSPAYSGSDDRLLEEIRTDFLEERLRIPVGIKAEFLNGQPAKVTMYTGAACIHVTGNEVQTAQKQPVTEENIRKQLSKLGDTAFSPGEIQITVSNNAFYPLKQINELRREAVALLEQKMLSVTAAGRENAATDTEKAVSEGVKIKKDNQEHGFTVSVSTPEQLETVAKWHEQFPVPSLKRIYIDGDLAVFHATRVLPLCERLHKNSTLLLALPYILREEDSSYLEGLYTLVEEGQFDGFLIRSLDGLGFLGRKTGRELRRADANLYVWNSTACEQLTESGIWDGFCIPYELNAGEQHRLLSACESPFEKIVYSRIPMMLTANCVLKTTDRCARDSSAAVALTDRYKKKFPVVRNCHHCMNIIYNSVPLSLWQERGKWICKADLRLDFTLETEKETKAVLDAFLLNREMPVGEYTSGHEKRGVE